MEQNYKNFEEALEELKAIVENLDKNKAVNLDELINKYEEGMKAYNFCVNKLEETQEKIRVIDSNVVE